MQHYFKYFWKRQGDAFRLSLATCAGCFVVAGALALLSATTAALHSAQGIALVGVFYFALALCGARWRSPTLALQGVPWTLRNRAALPPRQNTYRAAGGGWEQN